LSKIQEEQGAAVIDLHKQLGKHVRDMHTWKDFLEQDKEYDSVDLHITMAEDLKSETFVNKVDIIDGAFNEETSLLAKLLIERKGGKPVVSNNDAPKRKKVTKKKKNKLLVLLFIL